MLKSGGDVEKEIIRATTALAVGYSKGEFSTAELYTKRNEAFEKAGLEAKYRSRIGFKRPAVASDPSKGSDRPGGGAVMRKNMKKCKHVDEKK